MTDDPRKLGGPGRALLGTVFVFGVALGFAVCFGMGIQLGWNFGEAPPRPPTSVSVKVSPELEPKANTPEMGTVPAPPAESPVPITRPTTESLAIVAPTTAPAPSVAPQEAPVVAIEGVIPTPPPVEPEPEIWPGRFLMVSVRGTVLSKEQAALLKELRPAGVILSQANIANPEQLGKLIASIKAAVELGTGRFDLPLIGIEQEGGAFNPLGLSNAPSPSDLAKKGDVAKIVAAGQRYAEAAAVRGVAFFLAPVLNVADEKAADKTMDKRTFGSVPEKVAEYGLAFSGGILKGNVIPVAKGFPALGRPGADGSLPIISESISDMAGLMYAFAEASQRKIPGIMVSHVVATTLDVPEAKRSAAFSPVLVEKVLRDLWKYDDMVFADDIAVERVAKSCPSSANPAVEAMKAGCDVVLCLETDMTKLRNIHAGLDRAIADGILPHEQLVKAIRRLESWPDVLKESFEGDEVTPQTP